MLSKYLILVLLMWGSVSYCQKVPSATGSKASTEQAQSALEFHNKVRKDVGVPGLEWSEQLSSYAQAWASNLATEGCKLKHRPPSGEWAQKYGENIYYYSGPVTLTAASKAWYNEIKDYKDEKLTIKELPKIGHYTQMVWRKTTKLGMGVATCPSGATIVVANYSPMGNFIGQKPY